MTGAEAMIPGLVQIQTSILTELAVIGTNTSSLGHISGLFISPGESVGRYGSVAASCFGSNIRLNESFLEWLFSFQRSKQEAQAAETIEWW